MLHRNFSSVVQKKAAFIGLGNMGLPMALNLHKSGFAVHGFDLNPASVAAAKEVVSIIYFFIFKPKPYYRVLSPLQALLMPSRTLTSSWQPFLKLITLKKYLPWMVVFSKVQRKVQWSVIPVPFPLWLQRNSMKNPRSMDFFSATHLCPVESWEPTMGLLHSWLVAAVMENSNNVDQSLKAWVRTCSTVEDQVMVRLLRFATTLSSVSRWTQLSKASTSEQS